MDNRGVIRRKLLYYNFYSMAQSICPIKLSFILHSGTFKRNMNYFINIFFIIINSNLITGRTTEIKECHKIIKRQLIDFGRLNFSKIRQRIRQATFCQDLFSAAARSRTRWNLSDRNQSGLFLLFYKNI